MGVTALLQCLLLTHLSQRITFPCPLEMDVLDIPIPVFFLFLQLFIASSGDGRRDSQQCCQEAFPTKHALQWICLQRCPSLSIKLIFGSSCASLPWFLQTSQTSPQRGFRSCAERQAHVKRARLLAQCWGDPGSTILQGLF